MLRLPMTNCLVPLVTLTAVGLSGLMVSAADTPPQYNRDIIPIFMETCFACHGPDSASRKAELRLDQSDAAVTAGAIVPGQPDGSEMIRRILSDDPEQIMPPPELKKPLTDEQKKILVDWVKAGAHYEKHWSLISPVRPSVPQVPAEVTEEFEKWPRNPIDNFVLKRLIQTGLTPAAEADPAILARRVSFDITGLPPEPELVASFLNDSSENAYETLVDTLLKSERWGEHRGRYWLDYARYADTHGIHFDNYREMWSYRDWVIEAFNRNMPFDQFTIENLAGDMLPEGTLDQKIASGFNRCNMTTNEGGIIDEEYAVLYARDRTDTVSQVWLGLTAGCAVCHNHKFDPLSQREFYQLAAFFNNSTQAVRDGNIKDTPPIIVVPLIADRKRLNEIPAEIRTTTADVEARRGSARTDFASWLTTATAATLGEPVSGDNLHVLAKLDEGGGRDVQVTVDQEMLTVGLKESATWRDGPTGKALAVQGTAIELKDVGNFEHNQPFSAAAWVNVPANDSYAAICSRMDNANSYRGWDLWLQQRRIGMHIVNAWPERALKVVSKEQLPANEWVHVAVTYDGSSTAAGVRIYINGRVQPTNVENDKLNQSTIVTDTSFRVGQRSSGEAFNGGISDLRLYRRVLQAAEAESIAGLSRFATILDQPAAQRTTEQIESLYGFWLGQFDSKYRELSGRLASLQKEDADIKARGTIAHVMNERSEPASAYVLFRGEYDQRREQVFPETPAALPPFPADAPHNRRGFAQWLLLPEHPLTARVTVNRYWQEVFGSGIVGSVGDFGVSGELPTHPELLDWLAVDFREGGWDVKRLIKQIVMSATYRQSARSTPEKRDRDPANRLYSRGPRFRMDAEMVRDNALVVSGLLVEKIGGPSVKPYQPDGVWEAIAMTVSNTRSYQQDSGESLYRRSLYTFVKRMAPPASMDIFNAPNREYCVVRRERTNTPLQALATLNDEQFIEAARHLAQTLLQDSASSDEERFQIAARRLIARDFRPDELTILTESLGALSSWYDDHPTEAIELIQVGESKPDSNIEPPRLAAWTMICNQMMNLDEVLNK